MSKHKRVGARRDGVGKKGSPPSGTENEKPQKGKPTPNALPKESKKDIGRREKRGGGLH